MDRGSSDCVELRSPTPSSMSDFVHVVDALPRTTSCEAYRATINPDLNTNRKRGIPTSSDQSHACAHNEEAEASPRSRHSDKSPEKMMLRCSPDFGAPNDRSRCSGKPTIVPELRSLSFGNRPP